MMPSEQTIILPTTHLLTVPTTGNLIERDGPDVVTLIFRSGSLRLKVALGHEIVLGRPHSTNVFNPDVDLSAYNGLVDGASRLHASLKHELTGWYITDLNSSNGTWVNGKRLAPNMPHRLADVNDTQLGRLELQIKLPEEQRLL